MKPVVEKHTYASAYKRINVIQWESTKRLSETYHVLLVDLGRCACVSVEQNTKMWI